jgi:class 3 adenylate cyclase/predicted metal-dependent HD superfamily phosphohydrolase/ActR/RegA family two-component response regulator
LERFINILIIDNDPKNQKGLKAILSGGGNNILFADHIDQAIPIIQKKEIGILLINIDDPRFGGLELLHTLKEMASQRAMYKIVLTQNKASAVKLVKGLNEGAVDYITIPFNPNLIKAKIEVFKTLYYKDQRINQLLSNIFPQNVLEDLNLNNKFSPKRVENGIVLFTDFMEFSAKARNMKPIALLKRLDYYFSQFDEIVRRYKLEKVKTIGDSYMALAGVTEDLPHPALRACLAALEMRDFMLNEKDISKALGKDYWEMRIGMHMGPLVAGIIGTTKMSFDVWGDTVNLASRAEQSAEPGHISITEPIAHEIADFADVTPRGHIAIHKRGGSIEMHYLNFLKKEHCMYGEGKIASVNLRTMCGLSTVDFEHMRRDIINNLKALLPEDVVYHDINHTLNVEKAAVRFARLEGVDEESVIILQTAALYHDAGFILRSHDNEEFAVKMAGDKLPRFGYNESQIKLIQEIILATASERKPKNLLEKIMCDADHDYLGRPDYFAITERLRKELAHFGRKMTDIEWIEFQLNYMVGTHRYYTDTAKNIRLQGKKARIADLKEQLNNLKTEQ